MRLLACLLALVLALPVVAVGAAKEGEAPSVASQKASPRTVHDILAALDSRVVDSDKLGELRQQLEAPLPAEADAEFHMVRARAANELGLVGPQIKALRRAIELGGGRDPYRAWGELSGAEFKGGNFRNALAARLKSLELTPPNAKGAALGGHTSLADLYRRLGDFETARKHVRDAEKLLTNLRRSPNWDHYQYNWQAFVEDALGRVAYSAGRYPEAEARFRRALEYREQDVPQNLQRLRMGLPTTPPQINIEKNRDGAESWLAQTLRAQGRLREAEVHARSLAYRCIQNYGQGSLHTISMLQPLVAVMLEENRPAESLLLINRALANLDKLELPPTAFTYVQYLRFKAQALTSLGRWQEALVEYEAMKAALSADPELAETLGAPSLGWVRSLLGVGQVEAAVTMGEALSKKLREQMGSGAYDAAEAAGYYGAALVAVGRDGQALDVLRQALAVMIPVVAEQADRSGFRFQRLSYIIESYLRVLARVRGSELEKSRKLDAAAEAFIVADVLRGQSVQQAMAASSARAAAATPELAKLVREEQDARQERDALYKILADLMARPVEQMLPNVIASMQARAAAFDKQQKSLSGEIRQRYPDYADLAFPRPASISQIQTVLRPGEALLSVLPSSEQTYVWAIPARGSASFAALDLPAKRVGEQVARLRKALDPADFDLEKLTPFDGATAHQLYTELMLPVQAGWNGSQHLIVAGGGALSRLPFALLLSEPPPAAVKGGLLYAQYEAWPWLAKQMAVSQLPSAAALTTLRRMKPGAANRLAFAGFGDPDFSAADKVAGLSRSVASRSVASRGLKRGLRSTAFPASLQTRSQRGEEAAWVDYSRISPLPDTREEILSLAQAIGADPQRDVFLGAEASKQRVLEMDLSQRKVVAFATHGLLAGDFPGVDQPSLALANPRNGQNGLLTLDDILGLKLDADWVVLSACNTAGGDEAGGEAVSGLGRGFFYAGSRSLLVTHWPVESVSAKQLVVGVFNILAAEPQLSRAEALRRSMVQVMAAKGKEDSLNFSYAHPIFWAPYALVGDGGR